MVSTTDNDTRTHYLLSTCLNFKLVVILSHTLEVNVTRKAINNQTDISLNYHIIYKVHV